VSTRSLSKPPFSDVDLIASERLPPHHALMPSPDNNADLGNSSSRVEIHNSRSNEPLISNEGHNEAVQTQSGLLPHTGYHNEKTDNVQATRRAQKIKSIRSRPFEVDDISHPMVEPVRETHEGTTSLSNANQPRLTTPGDSVEIANQDQREHGNENISPVNPIGGRAHSIDPANILDPDCPTANISRKSTSRENSQIPVNRPLLAHHLQPQETNYAQRKSSHRVPKAIARASSKSMCRRNSRSIERPLTSGAKTISSMEMLQMAIIQANEERAHQEASSATARRQEIEIVDLQEQNFALLEQLNHVGEQNDVLVDKIEKFQDRCEKYKLHMNDVVRAQKQISTMAKQLQKEYFDALKEASRHADVAEEAAQKKIEDSKKEAWTRVKGTLGEAREYMDGRKLLCEKAQFPCLTESEQQTIGILKTDLNNCLLDLQRERGTTERLQKLLDDRSKQQQDLKDLLAEHLETSTKQIAIREVHIPDVLNAVTGNRTRCVGTTQSEYRLTIVDSMSA
jgi:hypothetical protein